MEYNKSEALVINCYDYRESSQIVTFYTRDYGKLSLLARGAKRLRTDLECPFDLLTHCQIVYIPNTSRSVAGGNILTGSKIYDNFIGLHYDYERLKYGLALAEFLNEMTAFEDANSRLFNLALTALRTISGRRENIKLVLFAFQIRALMLLGYLSNDGLKTDVFTKEIISTDDSRSVFALVRNLLEAKIPLHHLRVSEETSRKIYSFLDNYISCITGRQLKVRWHENENKLVYSRANSI